MSQQTATSRREAVRAQAFIKRVVEECPRRQATTDAERRAQAIVRDELASAGLTTDTHEFSFNDSLYANLALHFGLGSAGTVLGAPFPPLGVALHGLAALSYWGESTRRFYLLRRLLGFRPSHNVLATLPAVPAAADSGARDGPALRIVFLAHVDAAFTGLLFHPTVVRGLATSPPAWLRPLSRSMAVATRAEAAAAAVDALRTVLGPFGLPLCALRPLLAVPSMVTFALALEAVLRNEIVPGAADNLSGVAGMLLLAARLAARRAESPDSSPSSSIEYVFVSTGCEEASLGGADALCRDMGDRWDPARTVVLALDTLSNGDLRFVEREGEVSSVRPPTWLLDTIRDVAAGDERFAEVTGLEIPVGGSDAAPFLYRGYPATCLTCIDPTQGTARHYHRPEDAPQNIDPEKIVFCVDFVEALVDTLAARLGR